VCDTRLLSHTILLLLDVASCSIEELNMLSYLFFKDFLSMSVSHVTDGQTGGRKQLTGCGDLASWVFFMRVNILITSCWVIVPMISTFR